MPTAENFEKIPMAVENNCHAAQIQENRSHSQGKVQVYIRAEMLEGRHRQAFTWPQGACKEEKVKNQQEESPLFSHGLRGKSGLSSIVQTSFFITQQAGIIAISEAEF